MCGFDDESKFHCNSAIEYFKTCDNCTDELICDLHRDEYEDFNTSIGYYEYDNGDGTRGEIIGIISGTWKGCEFQVVPACA